MALKKKITKLIGLDGDDLDNETLEDGYYTEQKEEVPRGSEMILLEPRAYSESQQIADHLKKRNTVVVNMKRVTAEQAKRIIDFLSKYEDKDFSIKGDYKESSKTK